MQAAAKAEEAPGRNKNKPLESAGLLERLHMVVPPAHSSGPGGQHHGQRHAATHWAEPVWAVKTHKAPPEGRMAGTQVLALESECGEVVPGLQRVRGLVAENLGEGSFHSHGQDAVEIQDPVVSALRPAVLVKELQKR